MILQALAILLQALAILLQALAMILQALAMILHALAMLLQALAMLLQALAMLLQALAMLLQALAILLQALAMLPDQPPQSLLSQFHRPCHPCQWPFNTGCMTMTMTMRRNARRWWLIWASQPLRRDLLVNPLL